MRRRTFLKAMGLTLTLPATRVLAQGGRNIRMIVPLPAGSSNDSATRVISAALSPLLGQSIVVDNRAGGAGLIGTMDVVRAAPDGLTLMCGSLSPLAANVAFVKNLPYDPRRDLTPIAGATLTNHVLVVAPSSRSAASRTSSPMRSSAPARSPSATRQRSSNCRSPR